MDWYWTLLGISWGLIKSETDRLYAFMGPLAHSEVRNLAVTWRAGEMKHLTFSDESPWAIISFHFPYFSELNNINPIPGPASSKQFSPR